MLCGAGRPFQYLDMLDAGQAQSADSDAFCSGRVPNLKMSANSVALWHSSQRPSLPRQAPADHGRLDRAAGFAVAPFAIDPSARERQLISAAVILAQYLHRLIRWRLAVAVEFSQTSFARCHDVVLRGPERARTGGCCASPAVSQPCEALHCQISARECGCSMFSFGFHAAPLTWRRKRRLAVSGIF
jgi:hypothetical protein